jgi:hypothetical protein
VICKEYWRNDKHHRDGDKLAVIEYDAVTGKVTREGYLQNGKLHRDGDKLAVTRYDARSLSITRSMSRPDKLP